MRPFAHISISSQTANGEHDQSMEMQRFDGGSQSALLYQKIGNREGSFRMTWASAPWRITLIILALPIALAIIVVLAAVAEMASQSYIRGRDCYPNGLWKESPGATWRIMDSSYFFTPNLSFGTFTFTQVKVIDIAWDLIIGRGGQLLLAWVNYRVFNEWLVYHMEMHLTSYKLYAAVAFETTTMATLGVLGKEFLAFGKKSWGRFFRWLAILSMLLSTLYVLAFPTLMAAMTGYITTYELYIENDEHNLIDWNKIRRVTCVIEDADRIGYSAPLVITEKDHDLNDAVDTYLKQFPEDTKGNDVLVLDGPILPDQRNMTNGYFHLRNMTMSSNWIMKGQSEPINLEAPSLSITSYRHEFVDLIPPVGERAQSGYALEDPPRGVYSTFYLLDHGSCKPSETYQWGFSYIFLFMISIFNFIWACIMTGMWFDTLRGSKMYRSGRRPGLLRSIMDYSAAIRQELGTEAEYLEEDELRKRLAQSGSALMVPKEELRISRVGTGEGQLTDQGWRRRMTRGSTF